MWGCGAVGSARDWQSRGHGFESRQLHQYFPLVADLPGCSSSHNALAMSLCDGVTDLPLLRRHGASEPPLPLWLPGGASMPCESGP